SHGEYRPPLKPPQALKAQSTPRTSPSWPTTKVGPQSRIQESFDDISTSRTDSGSAPRAAAYWARETQTVTGSASAMTEATDANACWAGLAPLRQLSDRSGQSIQHPTCGSNSPGIRKPSCLGVLVSVLAMRGPSHLE